VGAGLSGSGAKWERRKLSVSETKRERADPEGAKRESANWVGYSGVRRPNPAGKRSSESVRQHGTGNIPRGMLGGFGVRPGETGIHPRTARRSRVPQARLRPCLGAAGLLRIDVT
jgi:hypothetical protein